MQDTCPLDSPTEGGTDSRADEGTDSRQCECPLAQIDWLRRRADGPWPHGSADLGPAAGIVAAGGPGPRRGQALAAPSAPALPAAQSSNPPMYSSRTTSAACEASRLQGEFALPRLPTRMRTQDPEMRMRVCWKSVDYLNACQQMPRTARLGLHNAIAQRLQFTQHLRRTVRHDRSKLRAGVRVAKGDGTGASAWGGPPPSPNRLRAQSRRVPGNCKLPHRPPKTLARSPCGSCDCFQIVMCMAVANVIWQLSSGWKHVCWSRSATLYKE